MALTIDCHLLCDPGPSINVPTCTLQHTANTHARTLCSCVISYWAFTNNSSPFIRYTMENWTVVRYVFFSSASQAENSSIILVNNIESHVVFRIRGMCRIRHTYVARVYARCRPVRSQSINVHISVSHGLHTFVRLAGREWGEGGGDRGALSIDSIV